MKSKADKPPTVEAPRAIRIEVLENGAWAMKAECKDVLEVPLAVNPDESVVEE